MRKKKKFPAGFMPQSLPSRQQNKNNNASVNTVCPVKQSYVTLAFFGVDSESVAQIITETDTDRQTDRRLECDVIMLVVRLHGFYHRKSLTSGSVGIASKIKPDKLSRRQPEASRRAQGSSSAQGLLPP